MSYTPTTYNPYDFANRRHIGPSPAEMDEMLKAVGAASLEALIDETVPPAIRQEKPLDWAPLSEGALLEKMRQVGAKNVVMTSLIGQGYYGTITPPAIQRNILENPAWYTAYTPYQPEIAQGRLEALLNYQTMVADLTGLPIANASLLDESTACAEAMVMAQRVAKSKARGFFVDENCHPQNIEVMKTRAAPLGIEVIVGAPDALEPEVVFGAIFQYPGTYGDVRDFTTRSRRCTSPDRSRSWRPTFWRSACSRSRARWAPTSPWARRSASACRWAMAARTRPSCPAGTSTSARCPAGSSASRSIRAATRPTGWPCRRASSI
jgi:glycine dehydrogenase